MLCVFMEYVRNPLFKVFKGRVKRVQIKVADFQKDSQTFSFKFRLSYYEIGSYIFHKANWEHILLGYILPVILSNW